MNRLEPHLERLSSARPKGTLDDVPRGEVTSAINELIPSMTIMLRLDDALTTLSTGGQCAAVTGLTPDEILSGGASFARLVHPDDLPGLRRGLTDALDNGNSFSVAHRLHAPDGEYRWALLSGSTKTAGDETLAHGVVINIENFRPAAPPFDVDGPIFDLMRAVLDGLCVIDAQGVITFANSELAGLLGYSPEEMRGLAFIDFVGEKWRASLESAREESWHDGRERYEIELLRRNGDPVRTLVSESCLFNPDGSFFGTVMMLSDITEERKTETSLRKSAERLAKIVMVSGIGAVITRLTDERILDANNFFLKSIGYSRDEVIGKTSADLGVLDAERRREIINRLMREGRIDDYEMNIRAKDGTIRHGRMSISLIGLGGEPCALSVGYDITARMRAENALRQSEENYRELVESANSIILRFDTNCNLVFINRYAEEFFGYSNRELVGRSVIGTIVPQRDCSGRDLHAMINGILADPFSYASNINENKKKNGERVLIAWANRPVYDENGRLKEVLSIGNDITERRRAEEALRMSEARFRAIFEDAAIGMGLVNLEGKILMANPTLLQMLGCEENRLVGSYFKGFVHPKDINLFCGCFENFAAGKRDRCETECRLIRASGLALWGMITISLVKGENLDPCYAIVMVEDISERKEAEDALRRSRESMRNLAARVELAREEERRGIAREIHDELGQTLTALKIDLSWLEKRLSGRVAGGGHELENKIQNMMEVVNRTMQSVHRISADLRPGVLDDLGLLPAIEWQLQQFRERTGIDFSLDSGSDSAIIDQDVSTAVFRILQESLTNVARHADATQIDVRLMISNSWLILRVKDNGRGISPKEASDPESLGLLGMRERAVGLGGSVGVSSHNGKGTIVEVRVPFTHEDRPK